MEKIIGLSNRKGGVGKTTSCQCIADNLIARGKRVLVIDCDPQCNMTKHYGAKTEDTYTLYDVYEKECSLKEAIQHTELGDIVPCDKALENTEATYTNNASNFFILQRGIKEIQDDYDYILLDLLTSPGFYLSSALVAATDIIIPVEAGEYALDGLDSLIGLIRDTKQGANPDLELLGILPTKILKDRILDRDLLENLQAMCDSLGCKALPPIRVCADIGKSQAYHERLTEAFPRGNAAEDYNKVCDIIEG